MTNKLVVITNSLEVPKIEKILLYEMKFIVPNYGCLQNPWIGGYAPRSPFSLSSTEFVEPLPPKKKESSWVRHCLICILSCITMHRETVTSKISLLVNLEKTSMNPLHIYTIQTSQSANIPNLLLPPNTPFSLLKFDLSTECSWSHRAIRCCQESVAGLLCWALLVGTGLLLGWVDPVFFPWTWTTNAIFTYKTRTLRY